jgi:hypothetical protein
VNVNLTRDKMTLARLVSSSKKSSSDQLNQNLAALDLQKLDFEISQATGAKYLGRRSGPSSQSWHLPPNPALPARAAAFPNMGRLSTDGNLVFDKQFAGKNGETALGVAVAPDDNMIYVAGTTTSFGAGFPGRFRAPSVADREEALDAVTWGGTGFEEGAGVAVSGGTVVLAATTTNGPPYSLLNAAARLSAPKSALAAAAGVLADPAGSVAISSVGATTPPGSTTFGGNFEAVLVRIAR